MNNHEYDEDDAIGIPRPRRVINAPGAQAAKLVTIDIHRGRGKNEQLSEKRVNKNGAYEMQL